MCIKAFDRSKILAKSEISFRLIYCVFKQKCIFFLNKYKCFKTIYNDHYSRFFFLFRAVPPNERWWLVLQLH